MGLNREEKAAVIDEVGAQVASAQAIIVAEYRGLEVGSITALRKQARESGVYLRVLKNTLARRAVAGTPFEGLTDKLVGPLIYGISKDPVSAAKVLSDFAKGNDKLVVKGGAYGGKALDADGIKALASIPTREVLLTQVAGLLQSPIARFARALAAVAEQKGGGAEAPAADAPAADAPAADTPSAEAPAAA